MRTGAAVQDIDVKAMQSQLLEEGAIFEDSTEAYSKGIAQIRKRYAPAARVGPVPWSRRR
jgi:hypothetical protein